MTETRADKPPILLPIVSLTVDPDANMNSSNEMSTLLGEVVAHPYMSLYYPILAPVISETEEEPSRFVEPDDECQPKSIRTSHLQKRPVVYATRIYDADAISAKRQQEEQERKQREKQQQEQQQKKRDKESERISAENQERQRKQLNKELEPKKQQQKKRNKESERVSAENQERQRKQLNKELEPKASQCNDGVSAERQRQRKKREIDLDTKTNQIGTALETERQQEKQRKKDLGIDSSAERQERRQRRKKREKESHPKENQYLDDSFAEQQRQQQRKQRKKDSDLELDQIYDDIFIKREGTVQGQPRRRRRKQRRKQRNEDLDSKVHLDDRSHSSTENSTNTKEKSKKTIDKERFKIKTDEKKEGLELDQPSSKSSPPLSDVDAKLNQILNDVPDCADFFAGGKTLRLTPSWIMPTPDPEVKRRLSKKFGIDGEMKSPSSTTVEKTMKFPLTSLDEQSQSSASSDCDQYDSAVSTRKRRRASDRIRRSSSSSSSSSSSLSFKNNNDDDSNDCKKRPEKRSRNSASLKAALAVDTEEKKGKKSIVNGESDFMNSTGESGRRYPKRKRASASDSSDGDISDDETVIKSSIISRSDLLPHQVGTWIDPDGKYPNADYESIIKQRTFNENYDEDVKTDSGEYSDKKWNKKFRVLWAYYRKHKTFNVTKEYPRLASWVYGQRKILRLKNLHPDRVRRLTSIGFPWAGAPTWMDKFMKLKEFKEKHGHVDVPKRYKDDINLGFWCRHQRALYNHERYPMKREQIDLLESIGFKWAIRDKSWMERLKELTAFKKKHGHFRVPADYPNKLARWLELRREEFARDKLSILYQTRLNALGHDWMIDTSKNEKEKKKQRMKTERR